MSTQEEHDESWRALEQARRFSRAHISYNYCGICGHVPRQQMDEPNRAPIKWWDPDDGWQIGTLCRNCFEDYGDVQPKTTDFAYTTTNGVCDESNTDEDIIEAL